MGKIGDHFGWLPDGDRVRLTLGELVDADGTILTWRARDAFLLAMHEHVPGFAKQSEKAAQWMLDMGLRARGFGSSDVDDPEGAVRNWASGLNVNAHWFLETIAYGLVDAAEASERGEGDLLTGVYVRAGLSEESIRKYVAAVVRAPGPHISLALGSKPVGSVLDTTSWPLYVFEEDEELEFEWNPYLESRADNEANAVAWFTAHYRAAQDAREKEAGGRRLGRAEGRRYEHFEWAVRYQVLRHKYADIARDAGRSRQAVTEAVQEVLALIELEPREPDRPGRKRQANVVNEEPDDSN